MILQIIFLIAMYPVLFILYFVLRGAADAKDGYCFGARMKQEWQKDEGVVEICTDFRRQLKKMTIILAVIPFATFFTHGFSIGFSIWMIWLLAVVCVPSIPFAKANKRVIALKLERGWNTQQQTETLTEIKAAGEIRRVKTGAFLPAIILSLAIGAWGIIYFSRIEFAMLGIMIAIFALMTPMFYGVALWMDRQKIEVINSDSDTNINYGRAKKNIWNQFWLFCAWTNLIYTAIVAVGFYFMDASMSLLLWGCIVYAGVALVAVIWAWRKMEGIEAVYADKKTLIQDDDKYWIWGMMYYNKNDHHAMVGKRNGVGTTMNMATPIGMWATIFGAAVIFLFVPACCIWVILIEYTPMQLYLKGDVLMAEQLSVSYEIPVEDMEHMTVISELPKWSKSSGTGMENFCEGTFYIRNVGKCEVFVNPQNTEFIKFEVDGMQYYMSGIDDESTAELLEQIEEIQGEK